MKNLQKSAKRFLCSWLPIHSIAATAVMALAPVDPSAGCGEGEGWGWWDFWGIDVTEQLRVDEGWTRSSARRSRASRQDYKPDRRSAYRGSKPVSQTGKAPTQPSRVKTLRILGPVGTEVTIERSINGLDWEVVDMLYIEDDRPVRWTESACGGRCPNYEYRCSGYYYGG